jgi:hypothetical protein
MEICTEAAPQGLSSGCSAVVAEYSGAWIGGGCRRVPAREPLGLGAQRHLSVFPAAAAHAAAQPADPSGGEEAMDSCTDDNSPHEAMQMATNQGA